MSCSLEPSLNAANSSQAEKGARMDIALSAARLIHQGASTQLWGLACPF